MEVAGSGFRDLPAGCIAHVISFTCPRDSCRSAVTSSEFRSAAESDTVWDRFLPSDVRSILDRAVDPVVYSSKKELYFRLCDSILIDGGRMSFALEKLSGAKCYMLSARELNIVWGDTPTYWTWLSAESYRHEALSLSTGFSEVAHLLNVCWLEIRGKIDSRALSPRTTYSAYLIYNLIKESSGFQYLKQKASVKLGANESTGFLTLQPAALRPRRGFRRRSRFLGMFFPPPGEETAALRADGWLEIELGEFFNNEGEDGEVEMCLMEVEGGYWKSGLTIQGIEVRPKKN